MHIEELIIEGFKSYATRTVISGWDAEFNAITGLNGSGKSNILDAICFVLGIENLRQVRATSLQDLIYKRGQAGIAKASVTIVFNNEDSSKSPVGFADHKQITVTRQIMLGGKNKYLVNGHVAQQKSVENLFQSVQLNVNNPHFLIMQGQITKVLNMRPHEILALIEETAGTRMYDDRKGKAIITLEKKSRKVEEIETQKQEVIEPRLRSLRDEKRDFLEYKRVESEIERMKRFLASVEIQTRQADIDRLEKSIQASKDEVSQMENEMRENKLNLERVDDEILSLTKLRSKEAGSKNSKISQLEAVAKETENELVRTQATYSLKIEETKKAKSQLDQHLKQIDEMRNRIDVREGEYEMKKGQLEEATRNRDRLSRQIEETENLHRSLSTCMDDGSSKNGNGYTKLLNEAYDELSQLESTIKQEESRIDKLRETQNQLRSEVGQAREQTSKLTAKIAACNAQLESQQIQLASIESAIPVGASLNSLRSRKQQLDMQINEIQTNIKALEATVSRVRFNCPDLKLAGMVKGSVAELVKIKDGIKKHETALEICAGGRLYNIVVEDDRTAKAILEGGRLQRRITIIPLNKIQPRMISKEKADIASKITGGKAVTAISLIVSSDQDVMPALEYVFGGTLICEDGDAAAKVAFDSRVGVRAVTLKGDVYEPHGTLSGGSAPKGEGSLLICLEEYRHLQEQRSELMKELEAISNDLDRIESMNRQKVVCDQLLYEISLLNRQLTSAPAGKLIERVDVEIPAEISECEKRHSTADARIKELKAQISKLEKEAGEYSNDREGKLQEIARRLKKDRQLLVKAEDTMAKAESTFRALGSEHEMIIENIANLEEEIKKLKDVLHHATEENGILQSRLVDLQTQHTGMRVRLETELSNLRRFDGKLENLNEQKTSLTENISQLELDLHKERTALAKLVEDLTSNQKSLGELLKSHPDLANVVVNEKEMALAGSAHELSRRLKALEGQHEQLKRQVNVQVMDMIDRVEAREASLNRMLETIRKDRSKIETTLERLDEYKIAALERTWRKVDQDFGAIFGDLLGGDSFCTLVPAGDSEDENCAPETNEIPLKGKKSNSSKKAAGPEIAESQTSVVNQIVKNGLQIRVRLGGVWKNGLAELSGGQRSVIALSLILALLQYRPAPMYILDEVDAALDQSHTENIGRLLRSRFKGNQFIVVSLKEGMFGNASVLFQTRFSDGVSSVTRTLGTKNADEKGEVKKPLKRIGGKQVKPSTRESNTTTIA